MASRKAMRRAGSGGGFTLIELTVVLMILIALAGVMVPLFGGYIDRSHNSAAAANMAEINKQVELYNVKYLQGYPDQFDSLLSNGKVWAGDGNTVPGISPAAAILMTPHTLAASEAASLNGVGINNLVNMTNATDSATFHNFNLSPAGTSGSDLVAVTAGTAVATINFAAMYGNATLLEGVGLPNVDTTNYFYMIVGLGQSCKAVGTVMADAPIHFDTIDPAINYQRYGVIFQVPLDSAVKPGIAGSPTHLVGAIGIHDAGLSGLDSHLQAYNQDVQTGN